MFEVFGLFILLFGVMLYIYGAIKYIDEHKKHRR